MTPSLNPDHRDKPVALVTGGGRGIGRGAALALAARGWKVAINYVRDAESAATAVHAAKQAGAADAAEFAADIQDLVAQESMVGRVMDRWGRIDLLVNNAGVAPLVRLDLLDTTPESWDRALNNNLRGPFFLTQRVARILLELKGLGVVPRPQIQFITSVSSALASINRGEYCVAKAGLSMVARLFAVKLAESGIPVYEIRPGIIATDMTASVAPLYDEKIRSGLVPMRRWGTPEDVAAAVVALAEGALPYSTGSVIEIDGGLSLPRL